MNSETIKAIFKDLKNPADDIRTTAGNDLYNYIQHDLKVLVQDEINNGVEYMLQSIKDMLLNSSEKRGALLAINMLIKAELTNSNVRLLKLNPNLQKLIDTQDFSLIRATTDTMCRMTAMSVSITTDYYVSECQIAFDWLSSGTENKKYAAALLLKEYAHILPNVFYQQTPQFFSCIFGAFREPKPLLRESAAAALGSALIVASQRDVKGASSDQRRPEYYKKCFNEIEKEYDDFMKKKMNADDWQHGNMLICLELLRCCNSKAERTHRKEEKAANVTNFHPHHHHYNHHHHRHPNHHHHHHRHRHHFHQDHKHGSMQSLASLYGEGYKKHWLHLSTAASSSHDSSCCLFGSDVIRDVDGGDDDDDDDDDCDDDGGGGEDGGDDEDDDDDTVCENQFIKEMMLDKITRIMVNLLKLKNSKSPFIHSTFLSIIPRIASFIPNLFYTNFLTETMKYLLAMLKSKEKCHAFVTIGQVAVAMGPNIRAHKEPILREIHQAFGAKKHKTTPNLESSIFSCFTMLVSALSGGDGLVVVDELRRYIEHMLTLGLSPSLLRSFVRLSPVDESLKQFMQQSLIRLLHSILIGRQLQHPVVTTTATTTTPYPTSNVPPIMAAAAAQTLTSSLKGGSYRGSFSGIMSPLSGGGGGGGVSGGTPTSAMMGGIGGGGGGGFFLQSISVQSRGSVTSLGSEAGVGVPVGTLKLALRTLRRFDFGNYSLLSMVVHCSESHLSHEDKQVRMEAIRTCSRLLASYSGVKGGVNGGKDGMKQLMNDILAKILSAAVVDEDADVRYCSLVTLGSTFDACLAQSACLGYLSSCLNDEDFRIREVAVCIVGRVCSNNPSFVLPFLRKLLIRLLTEMDYSGVDRNRVDAAHLLSHLSRCVPSLIVSYNQSILDVVLPKLKCSESLSSAVVVSQLVVLGDLVHVSGMSMRPWTDDIINVLISIMQETVQTSKQEEALRTLGLLVESTGCVVEPYLRYPQLLEVLLQFFKTEQSISTRTEAITVLGILGALDPHRHKGLTNQVGSTELGAVLSMSDTKNDQDASNQDLTMNELLVSMSMTNMDDYYPAVSIATLIRLLRNPSLAQYYKSIAQTISSIFKELGLKCVPHLGQVVPAFVQGIRTMGDGSYKEFLFKQLTTIISVVKQNIRPFLDDIFALVKEFWSSNTTTLCTIIDLLEQLVTAIESEFRVHLLHLIPYILQILHDDVRPDRVVSVKLLKTMRIFGKNTEDYLHFILPPIISIIDNDKVDVSTRSVALETIDVLTDHMDLTDYASRILHALVRTLNRNDSPSLLDPCMDLICDLALQLNVRFRAYAGLILPVLNRNRVSHERFEKIYSHICKRTLLTVMEEESMDSILRKSRASNSRDAANSSSSNNNSSGNILDAVNHDVRLKVDAKQLKRAWTTNHRASRDDWLDWLRRLSLELLKESPSPALRAIYSLANDYNLLARDLFNPAFVSCWLELTEQQQEDLIGHLEVAFKDQEVIEVTQTILNLAEFMEHCENSPLPLDLNLLSECAVQCRAYAKALHFKEAEFYKGPTNQILESLISINSKMQQPEAASGILEYVRKHNKSDLRVQERWYEKLHHWDRALNAYERQQERDPDNSSYLLGRMRCLESLGEWGKLHEITVEKWPVVGEGVKQDMARMSATAAWGLAHWSEMSSYISFIPSNTYDNFFFQSVINLHDDNFALAHKFIDQARNLLITELSTLVGESYNRAYGVMVNIQMLSELDEVIHYKLVPEKRGEIREIWWNRIRGCQNILEDWQKILQIRTLVLEPQDDVRPWLKFVGLCRKNNRGALAGRTLTLLLGGDPYKFPDEKLVSSDPRVVFAYLKYLWEEGVGKKQPEAFRRLELFVKSLSSANPPLYPVTDANVLVAKCFLKLGKWHSMMIDARNIGAKQEVVKYYNEATKHNKDWVKAWHSFAYANYEVLSTLKEIKSNETVEEAMASSTSTNALVSEHCKASIKGFLKSISLSDPCSTLQDTLRILTMWFEYGHIPDVNSALADGIKTVLINNWIQVIPQLIARIDTPRPLVGRLVITLLKDIGRQHPQALIYPLAVVSKSIVQSRCHAANVVLKNMREHSNSLVQQAMLVSEELIRVAILWHELWHEGLEEASRLYFGDRNIPAMLNVLEPLHQMLSNGAQTQKETAFIQSYGHDLNVAHECCLRYQQTRNNKELTQAWDLYYQVFKKITKQLPQLTSLELQYVSPKLLDCRDMELSVPGTYDANQATILIHRVQSNLNVISSKQRPRKLSIFGSNGQEYQFLLKGHEDLRQDERVMQLFGLVNSILLSNQQMPKRNLSIHRYAVIPLSTNSGLIGWVPNCDTLHSLIRDYRDKKKILLNIEHRIMLRMSQDYDRLMLMQKIEVFEHALENTNGDDLAKILWIKSPSSEIWFDRRTNYTRSLAVMSMVGYVLGLGDRHPSNLMLDRVTGKIMHIDFGDCFEVAMTREKFPEKIPFRLTRMLVNAMEVTGIEGNYRLTCERVMRVLRNHKDSLMAVLEAFVYDPLLNWRLMEANIREPKKNPSITGPYNTASNQLDFSSIDHSYASLKRVHESSMAEGDAPPEELNKKALSIINRVRDKLTGKDFNTIESMDVPAQVSQLIDQATLHENLCQCYIGWCPFW